MDTDSNKPEAPALADATGSAISLADFQDFMRRLNHWAHHGCSNHGCQIQPPQGMGTNATCQCTPYEFSERLLWLASELSKHGRYRRWPNDKLSHRASDQKL